jgi:hypothetical protein
VVIGEREGKKREAEAERYSYAVHVHVHVPFPFHHHWTKEPGVSGRALQRVSSTLLSFFSQPPCAACSGQLRGWGGEGGNNEQESQTS